MIRPGDHVDELIAENLMRDEELCAREGISIEELERRRREEKDIHRRGKAVISLPGDRILERRGRLVWREIGKRGGDLPMPSARWRIKKQKERYLLDVARTLEAAWLLKGKRVRLTGITSDEARKRLSGGRLRALKNRTTEANRVADLIASLWPLYSSSPRDRCARIASQLQRKGLARTGSRVRQIASKLKLPK